MSQISKECGKIRFKANSTTKYVNMKLYAKTERWSPNFASNIKRILSNFLTSIPPEISAELEVKFAYKLA